MNLNLKRSIVLVSINQIEMPTTVGRAAVQSRDAACIELKVRTIALRAHFFFHRCLRCSIVTFDLQLRAHTILLDLWPTRNRLNETSEQKTQPNHLCIVRCVCARERASIELLCKLRIAHVQEVAITYR